MVLGASTTSLGASWPNIAYVVENAGTDNLLDSSTDSTDSTTPDSGVLGTETSVDETETSPGWIKSHMGLSLGIVVIGGIIIFLIYKRSRKNKQ